MACVLRSNVYLKGLDGDYTTDFLYKNYQLHRGIVNWGVSSMKRNEILTQHDDIIRILSVKEDKCLVIDCKPEFIELI